MNTRDIAIYKRILARFQTFQIVVDEFECGGGNKGSIPSKGVGLTWEMLPSGSRGYIRGVARMSTGANLSKALREVWSVVRRWKDGR